METEHERDTETETVTRSQGIAESDDLKTAVPWLLLLAFLLYVLEENWLKGNFYPSAWFVR